VYTCKLRPVSICCLHQGLYIDRALTHLHVSTLENDSNRSFACFYRQNEFLTRSSDSIDPTRFISDTLKEMKWASFISTYNEYRARVWIPRIAQQSRLLLLH